MNQSLKMILKLGTKAKKKLVSTAVEITTQVGASKQPKLSQQTGNKDKSKSNTIKTRAISLRNKEAAASSINSNENAVAIMPETSDRLANKGKDLNLRMNLMMMMALK